MFKALYNHVNNIIEKYLQIYDHILIYLQWIKKEKLKLKQLLNHIHNDKKKKDSWCSSVLFIWLVRGHDVRLVPMFAV